MATWITGYVNCEVRSDDDRCLRISIASAKHIASYRCESIWLVLQLMISSRAKNRPVLTITYIMSVENVVSLLYMDKGHFWELRSPSIASPHARLQPVVRLLWSVQMKVHLPVPPQLHPYKKVSAAILFDPRWGYRTIKRDQILYSRYSETHCTHILL